MIDEDKTCCMCGEHKKFLGRVNTGKKYYWMECEAKINKSGMDYWKPCSFGEFFENWSKEIRDKRKGNSEPSNMFTGLKEVVRKFEEEEAKKRLNRG